MNYKIDLWIQKLGMWVRFLILFMVGLTFFIVILRYGFSFGRAWLQELVVYFHAAFFMLGASYTLLKDKHVRVDIFYNSMSKKNTHWVNLMGSVFFTLPVMTFLFYKSLPYVHQSFIVLESSPDAGGLPGRFIIKALIPLFCFLVSLQSISIIIRSFKSIRSKDL